MRRHLLFLFLILIVPIVVFSQETRLSVFGQLYRFSPGAQAPSPESSSQVYLVRVDQNNNVIDRIGPVYPNRDGLYGFYEVQLGSQVASYILVIIKDGRKVWEQRLSDAAADTGQSQIRIRPIVLR